ncbi:MAG: DUF1207 domain-containing protein [Gammaproteobacteria bacterium]
MCQKAPPSAARRAMPAELGSKWLGSRRLQVLMEYFNALSPNGHFFERDIEYFGPGVHF